MEATELIMQCAMANQKHNQKPILFCQIWEYGNNSQQECARQTQTQMGMSDQTHGRCRQPKCKDPNARINAKTNINLNMSLLDSIGNNIENAIQNVQAQVRSC